MNVFLDDERTAPEGWVLVTSPQEAIRLLATGNVDQISLDHDLGDTSCTGYDVLLKVVRVLENGTLISASTSGWSCREYA
jgi:hypothetical protein